MTDNRTPPAPGRLRALLAVVGGLVSAVLLAPTPVVQPLADRAARGYEGRCATFTEVEVDPGTWPVVARAVLGRLRGVSTHVDRVAFDNGAVFHDVTVSAGEINGPPLALGLRSGDAEIRGGRSSATVRFDDLERSLSSEGVTVDLRAEAGSLVADVDVPFLGVVPTGVDIVPSDGDLELRFAPYEAFPLPPLRVELPDPVELAEVEIVAEGLRVSSTVEGTLGAGDWGCAPATGAP